MKKRMTEKELNRIVDADIKRYRSEFLTLSEIQFLEKLRTIMNKKK
ncbi:hypothetical protein ACFLRQ_02625 [Bacteroidota bacterium]